MPIIVFFSRTPWRGLASPHGGAQVTGSAALLHSISVIHSRGPLRGRGSLSARRSCRPASQFCCPLNPFSVIFYSQEKDIGQQADRSTAWISFCPTPRPGCSCVCRKSSWLLPRLLLVLKYLVLLPRGETEVGNFPEVAPSSFFHDLWVPIVLSQINIFFQYSRTNKKKSSELHVKDCVLIKVVIQNTCLTRDSQF